MTWEGLFIVLFVAHLVGDFLLQTEWQATSKYGGLGPNPLARRALGMHVATYMCAFVPGLIALAGSLGAGAALLVAIVIAATHAVQDDGRLLDGYTRSVKHSEPRPGPLLVAIDQSFHILVLFGIALLVGA